MVLKPRTINDERVTKGDTKTDLEGRKKEEKSLVSLKDKNKVSIADEGKRSKQRDSFWSRT